MKNPKDLIHIGHYVRLVSRKRWFIIVPFCMAMVAGMVYAVITPKVYRSTTLIMVEPQRVPANYVKSIVSTDIESRISTISQQIMSRTNLEKIIAEYRLFSEPEHRNMFMEDKLESLRKRIDVQVARARTGNEAFSIFFTGNDPETTMKITNALATYFIDENLKVREVQAMGTNVFLDEELVNMRKRLVEIETALKDYRRENMGELPEQLNSNLAILTRLQEELTEKQKNLRESRAALATLKQQQTEVPMFQLNEPLWTEESDLTGAGDENSVKLDELKKELSRLLLKYKEQHPDVVRLKQSIAQLEAQIEKDAEVATEQAESEPKPEETVTALPEMGFQDLQKVQQREMEKDILVQEAELESLIQQIAMYQQRVENTPKREHELLSLKRDYDNIKGSYDSLVQRKLEAEIAVNMEKKQKGEQFRVLDPAKVPQKPISPNVKMIFALSIAVGLGIGGGIIFLFDFFDTTVRRPDDLESGLGLPVLSSIPRIYFKRDIFWAKTHFVMTLASIAVALVLVSGFAVLAIKGVDRTIDYVRHLDLL